MDQTTDEIEQQIYQERRNLGEKLEELQNRVRDSIDWRVQVRERPLTMVALAFGAGILLSAFTPRRRPRYASSVPDLSGKTHREWDNVKEALAAIVLEKGKDFAQQIVSQFGAEYQKRQTDSAPANEGPTNCSSAHGRQTEVPI